MPLVWYAGILLSAPGAAGSWIGATVALPLFGLVVPLMIFDIRDREKPDAAAIFLLILLLLVVVALGFHLQVFF
ncbi:MAG: hypothetical protein ACXADO_08020 [Candidatus Thorarchaeota archaeon]